MLRWKVLMVDIKHSFGLKESYRHRERRHVTRANEVKRHQPHQLSDFHQKQREAVSKFLRCIWGDGQGNKETP